MQISLVIPVRDEAGSIHELLESIAAQTLAPDEIVFVDGGSKDATVAMLKQASSQQPGLAESRIRLIEAGEATPGRGRNIGIAAARFDWVALTDAGIRLEEQWLERLAAVVLNDESTDVVYGNFEPVTETFFERCASLTYVPVKAKREGIFARGPSIVSSLIRRDVWRQVGGFPDLRAAEDLIFMERIEKLGFCTRWAPTATIWWRLRPDLGSTFRKFVSYSKHNVWAGRQRFWHYGIARQYALATPFVLLGVFQSPWWFAVPILGLCARTAKSIWQRREGRGLVWMLNPAQYLLVALLILTIDAATFAGWLLASVADRKPLESELIATGKGRL
jgi:glycosyltransferase involved in cell wall biosynthesis